LHHYKKQCYPPNESFNIIETCAEVNLQGIVNHTAERLLLHLEEVQIKQKQLDLRQVRARLSPRSTHYLDGYLRGSLLSVRTYYLTTVISIQLSPCGPEKVGPSFPFAVLESSPHIRLVSLVFHCYNMVHDLLLCSGILDDVLCIVAQFAEAFLVWLVESLSGANLVVEAMDCIPYYPCIVVSYAQVFGAVFPTPRTLFMKRAFTVSIFVKSLFLKPSVAHFFVGGLKDIGTSSVFVERRLFLERLCSIDMEVFIRVDVDDLLNHSSSYCFKSEDMREYDSLEDYDGMLVQVLNMVALVLKMGALVDSIEGVEGVDGVEGVEGCCIGEYAGFVRYNVGSGVEGVKGDCIGKDVGVGRRNFEKSALKDTLQ
ncbi:hypothetical protein L9F63_000570, partial [Diploptera punctata]